MRAVRRSVVAIMLAYLLVLQGLLGAMAHAQHLAGALDQAGSADPLAVLCVTGHGTAQTPAAPHHPSQHHSGEECCLAACRTTPALAADQAIGLVPLPADTAVVFPRRLTHPAIPTGPPPPLQARAPPAAV